MARRSLLSFWRSGRRLLRLAAKLSAAPPRPRPQAAAPRPRPAQPAAVPDPPTPNPGGLEQRLHLPPGLRPGAAVVVLLHGCGQEPEALAAAGGWPALADRLGFILLMPRQVAENNGQRCFNWYQDKDTHRDHGEVASIHAMLQTVLARHRADPARVFTAGLSAGAAMAACLLAAYPESFAGGATMAGLPAGCASGVVGAMTRMAGHGGELSRATLVARARALGAGPAARGWPTLSVWHGLADSVVAPGNAEDLVSQWCGLLGLEGAGSDAPGPAGVRRTHWRDGSGAVRVERVLVEGLGHVWPAAATAAILRLWGLDGVAGRSPGHAKL